MGTYAVTHVKKDNKIIPLSDSYDGYLSGMGLANLLSIKFIPTEKLKQLFNAYTSLSALKEGEEDIQNDDEEYEDPEPVSQRILENTVFSLRQDCQNDPETIEWFDNCLRNDIRTSSVGFGPLLYLDYAPHYGRDYDYCDYLIDLDKEEFSDSSNYTISFASIRKASVNHLTYFTNGDLSLQKEHYPDFLNKEENFEDLYPTYYDTDTKLTQKQLDTQTVEKERINQHIQLTLTLPQLSIDNYYKKQKAEEEAYRLKYQQEQEDKKSIQKTVDDENDDKEYGGYSIRNLQDVEPIKLRLILSFLQNLIQVKPEASFLLRNADWGLSEDFKEAGIRFFSPMTADPVAHDLFNSVMNTLAYKFKLSMNIFSSTGRWSFDVKQTEDSDFGFGFGDKAGPENCIYSLEMVKGFENSAELIQYLHPFLGYHMNYSELRPLLIQNKSAQTASFFMYFALLNRDIEVIEALYDASKEDISGAEKADVKRIFNNYLQSISDSSLIQTSVAEINNTIVTNDGFIEHLKTSKLIQDLIPYMNQKEKSIFGIS